MADDGTGDDDDLLRSVALRNATSILAVRQRADEEMRRTRDELERRSQELARSLAMVTATLESTTDAVLATDSQRRITACNENFARLWRLPPGVVAGGNHDDLLRINATHFADPDAFLARIDEIYRSGDAEVHDLLETIDGRSLMRHVRIQTVDGVDVGRVWTFRDITDRRRAEDALREEARVLDLLNRTGTLIASTLEIDAVLQAATDAATEISSAAFGAFFYNTTDDNGDAFQLVTLSGLPKEAFTRFGYPRATSLFGPTFRGEGPVLCADVLVDPRYGRWSPHHGLPAGHPPVRSFMAVPVISRTGDPIGGLFFGHPTPGVFTERAQRLVAGIAAQASVAIDNARLYESARSLARERERLIEAERAARTDIERVSRMKDEFLATLSHELRTPLTAVLGWAKVLLLKSDDPDSLKRGLQAIERNARAQAQLIEDLLDMNRIVSGKVRLDVQPTDLAAVIRAAVDSARPSAEAREIGITTVLDPAAGPISGDANRLQQIVWNLLSNSVKFTPPGGRIDVVLQRVGSHLELTVVDTGAGIAPEFLPHVFDRFRQADSSLTRTHGGLGLGLSIVKQLVELHGGTIRAHSDGPGRGASFTLSFPLPVQRRSGGRSAWADPAHALSGGGGDIRLDGTKVLVVDDEPDTRELIRHVLAECLAAVTTAASAAEGLALIGQLRPDVLISDIGMPDRDGYDFMREVRRLPADRGGQTPAIALTAFARSEDRTRALLAGYQMHLAKPIEPHELVATVASLSGRMSRDARSPDQPSD